MNDLQVTYFLTVAESGSFTRAAEKLFVSQPAVSKQIAALEAALGLQLLETPSACLHFEKNAGARSPESSVAGAHRGRTYRRPHSLPPVLKTGRYTGNDTLPL